MGFLRLSRKRALGVSAVLAALVGVVLFVVVPAFATSANDPIKPPSSPKGILPIDVATGGQPTDCSVFSSSAPYQYRISNPKSKPYTTTAPDGTKVTFTLTMDPPNTGNVWPAYASDKYVSFSSTGAAVVDVGINGGTDTARYNYSGLFFGNTIYGFVTSDGYLHAPAQSVDSSGNPTQLYSVSGLTFCYDTGGTASGTVFNDTNHNGVKNTGEGGLTPWTVHLYKSGSSTPQTATSGTDGTYSFSGLAVGGTYTVCIVNQSNFQQTVPTGASNCSGSGENTSGYTFTENAPTTGLDFGEVGTASISGKAFVDTNGNGQQDSGEGAESGLNVSLSDGSTTQTDSNGSYSFTGKYVGSTYTICISKPSGSTNETLPTSSTTNSTTCSSGAPYGYSFTVQGNSTSNDFGFQPQGSVSGTVYEDKNQNGTNDSGDTGQSGWTVNLYQGSTLVSSGTSDSTGAYTITTSFTPNAAYKLCEKPPSGNTTNWAQSEPLPLTPNTCTGTNERPKAQTFTPTGASDSVTKNFGNDPAVEEPCPPPSPFGTDDGNYLIQLATCKTQLFVFNAGTDNGKHFVSVWAADESLDRTPMVEKITWPYESLDQNAFTLVYDDTFPFSLTGATPMPYCNVDPRDLTNDPTGFTLLATYQDDANKDQVLPSGASSCLIATSETAHTSSGGTFVAYVFSDIDGLRGQT